MGRKLEVTKRKKCPIRRSFVEREEGDETPTRLAQLLRTKKDHGGKGGGLRISLLLSLIMICSKPPHRTRRVAWFWAELLGIKDPNEEDAQTIRHCLSDLKGRDFITRHDGEIQLLNEAIPFDRNGIRVLYTLPYKNKEAYITVPESFWESGLAGTLPGSAIAMYLIGLSLTQADKPSFFITEHLLKTRYGISRSSKKRGLAELVKRGVLTVETQTEINPDTAKRVRRNIYTIEPEFALPPPAPAPTRE